MIFYYKNTCLVERYIYSNFMIEKDELWIVVLQVPVVTQHFIQQLIYEFIYLWNVLFGQLALYLFNIGLYAEDDISSPLSCWKIEASVGYVLSVHHSSVGDSVPCDVGLCLTVLLHSHQ